MNNPYALPVKGECKLEDVLYWIYEREVIRLQKLHNIPAPWTADPILTTYRFCNVDRKHDKISEWLVTNVYEPRKTREDLWLLTLICRLINWPPTLEKLFKRYDPKQAEDFDPDNFCEVLQGIVDSSEKAYGGAYVVYPGREPGVKKSEFLAHKVLSSAIDHKKSIREALNNNSIELSVLRMSECFGVSTFMSGQAISDLTYVEDQLDKAEDLYTYAPQGPGSIRGLNRLCGRNLNATWGQKEFNNELEVINEKIISELGFENLSLHSIQNVMCEMDKYWRVLNGEGRPRTRYCPETSF